MQRLFCAIWLPISNHRKNLLDRLSELRSEFGLFEQRLLSYQYEGENGLFRMREIMKELRLPLYLSPDPVLRGAVKTDYLNDNTGLP